MTSTEPTPPRAETLAPAPDAPAPDAPAAVPTVVLAEDEALIRLDMREMLEEQGYAVVGEAGDGETAVLLVEQLRPDLVLLDVRMPVMDGITAAERIVAGRLAPVVMVTAYSQRDQVERARDAGAMAYVVKPFTVADLVPAIELARSRFAEMRALESQVADLSERLETRKLVERAKARLQTHLGMSEADAFGWIQRTAMDKRTTMRDVARLVLDQIGAGEDSPTPERAARQAPQAPRQAQPAPPPPPAAGGGGG